MESVSQERIQDIYEHMVALGEATTSVTYEHWEWEEAGKLMYQEGQRIRRNLEERVGSTIRVVIENGRTAMEKILHFIKEEEGENFEGEDPTAPSPLRRRKPQSSTPSLLTNMAA